MPKSRTFWLDSVGDISVFHAKQRTNMGMIIESLNFLKRELKKPSISEEVKECLTRNIERITDALDSRDKDHILSKLE